MTKDGWQATALFAIALLILTNAVQFYTRRVEAVERADTAKLEPLCPEKVSESIVKYHPPEYRERQQPLPSVIVDPAVKCFGGTPMKKDKNGVWQQVGGSC